MSEAAVENGGRRLKKALFASTDAFADRVNPILVREVQQTLGARGFLISLILATALVIGLAVYMVDRAENDPTAGRTAFGSLLAILMPMAGLFGPMQAFTSTRQEMQGGVAEQLSLTRLSPLRIVVGKAMAGLAMFSLFLWMFAPLFGVAYLLRGVDVVMIALGLLIVAAISVLGTVFAVSMALLGRNRQLLSLSQLLLLVGLGFLAFGGASAAFFGVDRVGSAVSSDLSEELLLGLAQMAFLTALFAQVAMAMLSHSFTNRSRGFRILFLVGLVFVLAQVFSAPPVGSRTAEATIPFLVLTTPLWLGFCSESPRMGRYLQVRVSRKPLVALLQAPFVSGCSRGLGLLFTVVLFLGLLEGLVQSLVLGRDLDRGMDRLLLVSCQVLFLGALALAFRRLLDRRALGQQHALVAVVLLVSLGTAAPVVFHRLMENEFTGWTPYGVLSPWHMVVATADTPSGSWARLIAYTQGGLGLVASVVASAVGLQEVLRVSNGRALPSRGASVD